MKNIPNFCPAFMKRLWCQLAISYTALAFCAMLVFVILLYSINDYRDFHATLTLDNVEKQLESEKLTVTQAIREADAAWLNRARDTIREKLVNLEHGDNAEIYRITNSSRPEVYIQITGINNQILLSSPTHFPPRIANAFTPPATTQTSAKWLDKNIWVDMPITDNENKMIGHVQVLYIATFDVWVQFLTIINFLLSTWNSVFLLSVPIGIACSLVAARYVTKQLQNMNKVTERWRQGHFEARIALPNDDVLIRHSQHLNDMAQDLEMYLSLKQNLAVTDERNRVARELHDTVKQKLFALGLQLATAKSKPVVMDAAGEHIIEAETITREAQHDLMEIITQLRPTGANNSSLYERLGIISEDFKRRFGVAIELDHSEAIQYNLHTEHHVLRIVQESLINAVRHGEASIIVITITINHDTTTVTIADNGHGFDLNKKTGGFGITSMRDRIRDLPDGKLDIHSTRGTGTTLTFSWKHTS